MMRRRRSILSRLTGATLICSALCFAAGQSAHAYDRTTPVVEAVQKVLPAVVNISTSKDVIVQQRAVPFRFSSPFFNFPFDDLFEKTYRFEGLGSGVIVEGGYVVTNNHVIDYDFGSADKIFITTYGDFNTHEATIVGSDPRADLAILKVEGEPLKTHLSWGRSDDLMIGETVIAVGNALGQPFTVTNGIISALNRTIEEEDGRHLSNLIQTNADINRGNSGGPLVNINGEFIGLNTAIISPSGGSVGLGFAIPASRIKKIYDYWVKRALSLEDNLGIQVQEITPPIDYFFRNEFPEMKDRKLQGVVVTDVLRKGAAAEHLRRMDLIVEIDQKPVKNADDFAQRLEEHRGGAVAFGLIREGKPASASVPVVRQTIEMASWMGMELQEIDNHWRNRYDLGDKDEGLVVALIEKNGSAIDSGLKPGDIITSVYLDRKEYRPRTLDDIRAMQKAVSRPVETLLDIIRQKATYRQGETPWEAFRVKLRPAASL